MGLTVCKLPEREANGIYRIVMQSRDGDVSKNFIAEVDSTTFLNACAQAEAIHPGFTALWI